MAEKCIQLVHDMYDSGGVHCRSNRWLQDRAGTGSRIGSEPILVCYGDGQTDPVSIPM